MLPARRRLRHAAWVLGAVILAGVLIAHLDLQPNLERVNLSILSGPRGGRYYSLVDRLAEEARRRGGYIENLATDGSFDNVARLSTEAQGDCRAQFAVVQDGLSWPDGVEYVARLPIPDSVILLGRQADHMRSLADLRGLRIGIGPDRSGTAALVRQMFEDRDLASLRVTLVNLPFDEMLSRAQDGRLDLASFVMAADAPMIEEAVHARGLAILSFPFAGVVAGRLTHVRTGTIPAGHYDPVRVLPPVDKSVLQLDTLVVGNRCAKRSAVTGLLVLLTHVEPDLFASNRATPAGDVAVSAAARSFFQNGGPDVATAHVPWAVDIMPVSNWVYLVTAVSLLLNASGLLNRFQLWRIDAERLRVEERVRKLFGPQASAAGIAHLEPMAQHRTPASRAEIEDLVATLERLNEKCRRQSTSIAAEMGQEMFYRYQEHLMTELLDALRSFCGRVDRCGGPERRRLAS